MIKSISYNLVSALRFAKELSRKEDVKSFLKKYITNH